MNFIDLDNSYFDIPPDSLLQNFSNTEINDKLINLFLNDNCKDNIINENKENYYSYLFISNEKSTTRWKTLNNNNKSHCDYVLFEEIKEFFEKNKKFSCVGESFINGDKIKDIEYKLIHKKRKREKKKHNDVPCINIENKDEDIKKVKRGRKIKLDNPSRIEHTKYSDDNIIKNIKVKIFIYPLYFLNNILDESINNNKYKLCKLNYKYINRLKKGKDLDCLEMSLKDIYSFDITSKYQKFKKKNNKNIINKIIKKEIIVKDYETIMFALNLSLRNWMELFTYKKNIYEVIQDYKEFGNANLDIIEKCLIGVEDLLQKIFEKKNDKEFFSIYTLLLYNYERWFSIKRGRILKNKNNNI